MIITALLSFFDEPAHLLVECVDCLARVGVDRLVAVDGPYALYPHETTRSTPDSVSALRGAASAGDIDLTLVQVARPWEGNEVGKRQRMLEIALGKTPKAAWARERSERDWLLVVDADHFWESDEDLHRLLHPTQASSEISFASVSFAEVFQPDGVPIYAPARPLLRARRDLRMGTNHFTYELDDGFSTFLERPEPTTPVIDLSDHVRVIHGVHDRDPARRGRQRAYYNDRDAQGVER